MRISHPHSKEIRFSHVHGHIVLTKYAFFSTSLWLVNPEPHIITVHGHDCLTSPKSLMGCFQRFQLGFHYLTLRGRSVGRVFAKRNTAYISRWQVVWAKQCKDAHTLITIIAANDELYKQLHKERFAQWPGWVTGAKTVRCRNISRWGCSKYRAVPNHTALCVLLCWTSWLGKHICEKANLKKHLFSLEEGLWFSSFMT